MEDATQLGPVRSYPDQTWGAPAGALVYYGFGQDCPSQGVYVLDDYLALPQGTPNIGSLTITVRVTATGTCELTGTASTSYRDGDETLWTGPQPTTVTATYSRVAKGSVTLTRVPAGRPLGDGQFSLGKIWPLPLMSYAEGGFTVPPETGFAAGIRVAARQAPVWIATLPQCIPVTVTDTRSVPGFDGDSVGVGSNLVYLGLVQPPAMATAADAAASPPRWQFWGIYERLGEVSLGSWRNPQSGTGGGSCTHANLAWISDGYTNPGPDGNGGKSWHLTGLYDLHISSELSITVVPN